METEKFSPAARLKIKEKERKRKFGFTRISPPANTWDTLEKRWDTLARMLAPALVTSNFNTPPFKKFTLATVTVTRLASTLRRSARTTQNKANTLDRCRLHDKSKNQDTCSLSARNGAMWTRRFVPLAAVNPEAIHVRCWTENASGADAAVLQSVDQSVLQRCRLSRQNNVGQINLANIRNMPRRL